MHHAHLYSAPVGAAPREGRSNARHRRQRCQQIGQLRWLLLLLLRRRRGLLPLLLLLLLLRRRLLRNAVQQLLQKCLGLERAGARAAATAAATNANSGATAAAEGCHEGGKLLAHRNIRVDGGCGAGEASCQLLLL